MRIANSPRLPLACVHALAWQETSDAELLRRYCAGRDEDAFAELVRRNGPLVLRTCRHVVGDRAAAEDVFQATFLLLVRKAGRLSGSGSLAGWLHAAAVRLAQQARRAEQRRLRREKRHAEMRPALTGELTWPAVREALDAELAALPERYRLPLVLCYLQELTYEEAARRVPCSPGVLRGRLQRGKRLLRQRLAPYGLPLAAPLLALGTPAPLPAALRQATLATTRASLDGAAVPPAIAALVGTSRSTKLAAWSLALVLCLAAGVGWAIHGTDTTPSAEPSSPGQAAADNPKADGVQPPRPQADALGDPLPPGAVARLGTRRYQVSSAPVSVAGGKALLFYQAETHNRIRANEFHWMDAATGKILETWQIPQGPFPFYRVPAGVSADGRWTLLVEDKLVTTGARVGKQEKYDPSFAFYVFNLSKKREVMVLRGQHERDELITGTACRFSADGKRVVTSTGSYLRLWNIETGAQEWLLRRDGEQDWQPLGFAAKDAEIVFRGSRDSTIYVVDAAKGKLLRHFAVELRGNRGKAVLSPDGSAVLMASQAPEIRLWDLKTGKELAPLAGHKEPVSALAFSQDGKTLVTGGRDSFVLVRDWPSGKVRRQLELGQSRPAVDHLVVGDDQALSVRFGSEKTLRRYDLDSGKALVLPAETHWADVHGVAVAPDGSLVSLGRDNMLRVWDLARAKQIGQLRLDHQPADGRFGLSTDGKLVAFAESGGSSIVILDRDTGKTVRKIATPGAGLDRVEFSPDGRLVAATGPEASVVNVWNVNDGEPAARVAASKGGWWTGAPVFAFSPDAKWLLVTNGGRVEFWETHSWKMSKSFREGTYALAFSPDGRMVACPCLHIVTIWETATAKERSELKAHAHYSLLAQFSPDSRYLAWTTAADTVEVWDVARSERVALFEGHDCKITAMTFSRDGRHLVTASEDCTLLVWELPGRAV
jgi:RNA polymerase sigma factor (sigma-70 family)